MKAIILCIGKLVHEVIGYFRSSSPTRTPFSVKNPSSFISFELLPFLHHIRTLLFLSHYSDENPPPKVDRFSNKGVSWRWRSGQRWVAEMEVWSKMGDGDGGLVVGNRGLVARDGGSVEDGWQRWRFDRRRRKSDRRWVADMEVRWPEMELRSPEKMVGGVTC